ncbi:hypothetical protein ONZ45_g3412 [Pleurotus djamor]|nr:hypothetical protein ONZ45_g3412 [Pleurotus djamor]
MQPTTRPPARKSINVVPTNQSEKDASDPCYLGSALMRDSVKWVAVSKLKGELVRRTATLNGVASHRDKDEPRNSLKPSVRALAVLSIVAHVCEEDLWVDPPKLWRENRKYSDGTDVELRKTKMSLIAEPVDCDGYEQDWATYLANVEAIQAKAARRDAIRESFLLPKGNDGVAKLKLRHAIFLEAGGSDSLREPASDEDKQIAAAGERHAIYTAVLKISVARSFDGWPMSEEIKDAWEELKRAGTHQVNPLPLYDEYGKLVSPCEYEKRLQGATASIRFTLVHHFFPNEQTNVFTANVVGMDVISPSKPELIIQSTSKERKDNPSRDDGERPRKKRAT